MAEDSSTNKGVLEVKIDSNKSYKDLEEEIAAVASAVGGAKTVGGRAFLKTEPETEIKSKPSKPESAPSKLESARPKIKQSSSGLIENNSQPSDESIGIKEKDVVLSRHGKNLKPINDIKLHKEAPKPEISQSEVKPTPKSKDETVNLDPNESKAIPVAVKKKELATVKAIPKKPIKTVKPYPVIQGIIGKPKALKKVIKKDKPQLEGEQLKEETDRKETLVEQGYENESALINEPKQEPRVETIEVTPVIKKPVKHTPHVARLYDTKTYHIPLSVDHHNRKSAMPMSAQIITVVFAIIVVGLAVLWSGTIQF